MTTYDLFERCFSPRFRELLNKLLVGDIVH